MATARERLALAHTAFDAGYDARAVPADDAAAVVAHAERFVAAIEGLLG